MGGGKSSKTTVGYKFYAGASLVIAKLIHRILQVKIGDKVGWTGSLEGEGTININNDMLFGTKAEGGVVGTFAFQPGLPDQMPDPYLISKLGPDISASRGVSQLILRQVYMGNNPYLKDITVRGERIHIQDDGSPQWYDEKAAILNAAFVMNDSGLQWRYNVIARTDTTDYSSPTFDDSAWPVGLSPFGSAYDPSVAAYGFDPTPQTLVPQAVACWLRADINFNDVGNDFIFEAWVDNGIQMYVNGVKVVDDYGTFGHYYTATIDKSHFVAGVNHIAIRGMDDTGTGPGVWFWFSCRLKPMNQDTFDMNPAHMLRECLLNPEWGYGYDEDDLDIATFVDAADKLYAEQFGLSYFWDDDNTQLDDVINKILDHIDGTLFVSRETLKWTVVLIRADYDPDDLIELRADIEVISISNYKKPEFLELVNTVTVNFYDTQNGGNGSIPGSDSALFLQQGVRVSKTTDYEMCCRRDLAALLVQRELNVNSQPLSTCDVQATSAAKSFHRGKPFKLTSARQNYNQTIMRVTDISFGDGTTKAIKISCVEDKFGMPAKANVSPEPPVVPTSPTASPLASRMVMETPYSTLVSIYGQTAVDQVLATEPTAGFFGVSAARNNGALYADIYSDPGAGYDFVQRLDFCPYGELTAAIAYSDTTATLKNMEDIDELDSSVLLKIDDEIMALTSLNTSTGVMAGLKRGVFDTIPAAHDVGAKVFFFEDYFDGAETQYVEGESLNVKLLTHTAQGDLSLSSAPVDVVEFDSRAYRPYPPANYKVDGVIALDTAMVPSVSVGTVLTWAYRNRIIQADQVVDWFEPSVGIESDVTYEISVRSLADTEINVVSLGAVDTYTIASGDLTGGDSFILFSVRGGKRCSQYIRLFVGGHYSTEDGLGRYTTEDGTGYYSTED